MVRNLAAPSTLSGNQHLYCRHRARRQPDSTQAPGKNSISYTKPRIDATTKLSNYTKRFHHDANLGNADTAAVTDGELKPYVQRAFALVYRG